MFGIALTKTGTGTYEIAAEKEETGGESGNGSRRALTYFGVKRTISHHLICIILYQHPTYDTGQWSS
jgi:hypothetical protein